MHYTPRTEEHRKCFRERLREAANVFIMRCFARDQRDHAINRSRRSSAVTSATRLSEEEREERKVGGKAAARVTGRKRRVNFASFRRATIRGNACMWVNPCSKRIDLHAEVRCTGRINERGRLGPEPMLRVASVAAIVHSGDP